MKNFMLENLLDRLMYYLVYVGLRYLQFMAFVMWCIVWCLNKAEPLLRSWSEKLKNYAIVNLKSRELWEVSLDDDIVEPTQPEKQSSWEGKTPKVHITPLSTGKVGPHVADEVSEVTGDKPDSTEETDNITKDTPAPLKE